ncbi:glycolate oxidase subunit GlcE [Novispirillum sp. DQ9]|uniref:glycolate oxidase subunit GlcE n=1 Tax=Novispirillum sp. DQ9 TaxID=3398612 RepID=UPI003C7C37A4
MNDIFRPSTEAELAEVVAWAADCRNTLALRGSGSKQALGRPVEADHVLDLGGLSGITEYVPAELMLTARAGTPMEDIRAALAEKGQHLAFEPPDLRPLLGGTGGEGTLGGVVSCNLGGPRRMGAGAARDHVLGVRGVGGNGAVFKAGGKVVKNVTGFDLSKLLCGAYGTLAALSEITIKVLPRPEKVRTVLVFGLDDAAAVRCMGQAARSRHEVSACAHLPEGLARASGVDLVAGAGRAVTAIRVEGPEPSVAWRCQALRNELAGFGDTEELHSMRSARLWEEVARAVPLAAPAESLVWRLSVPPASAADVVARIRHSLPAEAFYDWAGGLVWLAVAPGRDDAGEEVVRGAVAHVAGGHATLFRAPAEVRARVAPFQPQPGPLAALSQRLKDSLDPGGVFNPGRMVPIGAAKGR